MMLKFVIRIVIHYKGCSFLRVLLYIVSIILANVTTAGMAPFQIGPFLIPPGTFLIGATFILRDVVQEQQGRKRTYLVITAALVLSGVLSFILGDTLTIMIASAISFALSETTDTEIYSRLKLPMKLRVFWSGTVGGTLDSAVFVIIGLSPIGAGFIPWRFIPMAIAGQVIVKVLMQAMGVGVLSMLPKKLLMAEH
jgi:queuosine precursor transporter